MQTNETKQKTIGPKVYGLILESRETIFLSIQYAYSLEEAFILAKLEFEKLNPARRGINNPLVGSKIGLFTVKTIDELTAPENMFNNTEKVETAEMDRTLEGISKLITAQGLPQSLPGVEIPAPKAETPKIVPEEKPLEKNTLMKQIIQSKDLGMFEKHKRLFSKAEKAYLRVHLK